MKSYFLLLILILPSKAFSCDPPPFIEVPAKCQGKTDPMLRKLIDVSTDFPKGVVTHSESLISFELNNDILIDCLEKIEPEWKWLKPYYFNKNYYRSCHITMSSVCEPKATSKKMEWYCDTSPDTCGRPIHPTKYVIEPDDFKNYDAEMLKKLNAKVLFVDQEELRKFAVNDQEKFLKFKVKWSLNPKFDKTCEKYKDYE